MERKDVVDDVLKNYLWFHLPKKESKLLQEYFISTCVELSEINSVGVTLFFIKLIWVEQDIYKIEYIMENIRPLLEKYSDNAFTEEDLGELFTEGGEWDPDLSTFKLVLDISFYRFGIINIKSTAVTYLDFTVGGDTENFKTNKEALNLGIIGNKELEEKVRNKPEDNWLSEILQWKKGF